MTIEKDLLRQIANSTNYVPIRTAVSAKVLTVSFVDFSGIIDTRRHRSLGIYVICDTNDSRSIDLQVVGVDNDGNEYEVDGVNVKTVRNATESADINIYYEFEVGSLAFCKIQAKAGTVGASAGDLTIKYDLK